MARRLVKEHGAEFLRHARESYEGPLPRYVEDELRGPAGILQPPFYANTAPMPTNYGGIGMVMGHELTHGFDDEGRQFDAEGNLKDWWGPAVNTEFERRAACVQKQYVGYTVLGDVHVNGKLTLARTSRTSAA